MVDPTLEIRYAPIERWNTMKIGLISAAVLAALAAATTAISTGGAAVPADYRGTYVTSPNIVEVGEQGGADQLAQSASSGVFIRIAWRAIETGPGRFDWTAFDSYAVPAIRARKNLSVGILSGIYAPDWLGDQLKVPFAPFRISQRGCIDTRIYYPWSQAYQDRYLNLLRGVKQHLQAIGGYDNLKIVKVSFIAQHTLEPRIPRRRAGKYDGCDLPDAPTIWLKAGYRPSLVVAGYSRVVTAMANDIFPAKLLSQPTQRGNPFPDIDDSGKLVAHGVAAAPLVDSIISACLKAAPGRCAIQNQSLQTVGAVGGRVVRAKGAGAVIGWQTALNRGRARCQNEDPSIQGESLKQVARVPCTADGYRRVLDRGITAGASYLELWPVDVQQFASVVADADRRLRQGDAATSER